MRSLRACLRLCLLAVANLILFPFGLATRLPLVFGRTDMAYRWGARVQRAWSFTNLRILGVRVRLEGDPPRERALILSNHCSYLDILVLGTHFPGRFIAKSEIAGWPAIGALARSVGTIFLDQRRPRDVVRVGEEMKRTLTAGVSVILFPEGKAHRGERVEPFHTGLFSGAAREEVPCRAVALHYATPGVPYGVAWTVSWWGGMDLQRHLWRLLGLPGGIVATVRPDPVPRVSSDRRALAEAVRRALEARFEPLSQDPIPPDNPWPELETSAAEVAGSVGDPAEA